MSRHLHIEPVGGASGDMFLGMLLDLGLDEATIRELPARLGLASVKVDCSRVRRATLDAGRVEVRCADGERDLDRHAADAGHGRKLDDALDVLRRAKLPEAAARSASRALHLLYGAEAEVHGKTLETVHLHEAGADDALVDVAGTCLGLELLGVSRVSCGVPIPLGGGRVRCAHGDMPVPVPAVTTLLAGVDVEGGGARRELVTPTGAALLRALVDEFRDMPRMTLERTGMGAGTADPPDAPNVLRGLLGRTELRPGDVARTVSVLECAVDDVVPQDLPVLVERLLAAGARDAFVQPVIMKKGRPGFRVTVIGDPDQENALVNVLLEQGPTLGVRARHERRAELSRDVVSVGTPWGAVRVKRALAPDGRVLRAAPEFDDVKRVADEEGLPLDSVRREAQRAHDELNDSAAEDRRSHTEEERS